MADLHPRWCAAHENDQCLSAVDDTSDGSGVAVWLQGTATDAVVRMDVPLSVPGDDLEPATLTVEQALDIAIALRSAVRAAAPGGRP